MTLWRVFLAVVMPPLAVLDKGCGIATLVFALMLLGWFPGVIAALVILSMDKNKKEQEKAKRKGAYLQLADGEVAEVVEDDGAPLEKRKRGES